jgi:hypothetical protein
MSLGARKLEGKDGESITWYRCSDCGYAHDPLEKSSMRPNNKFCDKKCMIFVLEHGYQETTQRPRGWKEWVVMQKEETN